MDYSFCSTSWDCWYAWLWSSPTAAWIQGLATIGLLYVTWKTWEHDRERGQAASDKEERDRHRADMLNLEKIIQYMAGCAQLTEQFLIIGQKHRSVPAAKLQANKAQLQRATDELGWFIRHDRSHYQVTTTVMAFHVTCQQLSLVFDSVLAQVRQQSDDEISVYTAQLGIDDLFVKNLRDSVIQMDKFSELIATYRRSFAYDRNASFPTTEDAENRHEEA